jgi:hypothetical protein
MNFRLSKWMVLHEARPMLVGLLLLVINDNFGAGTIKTSSGKARYKSPFLARQLSMIFTPERYRMVKIACSCSEMVL